MLEFVVVNLIWDEVSFQVPSQFGVWEFRRAHNYGDLIQHVDEGKCANTFRASINKTGQIIENEFFVLCDEIVDVCLVLSFLTARCVTVSGTSGASEMQFLRLPDFFIRPRGIVGFPMLKKASSLSQVFLKWQAVSYPEYRNRQFRLMLSHWMSGLTCFSLEDIFLSLCVQMDVIKQRERLVTGNMQLSYYDGMVSASHRYGMSALSTDYKNMRNDLVHEGVLSGTNFFSKSKAQCASVVDSTLNWMDEYVLFVLNMSSDFIGRPRWQGIEHQLPSVSIR